ncbi:MAG: MFS transporter [Actinomycetia bacterium]|nr:MFS transporter [Actinomycetes bacterium]
MAAAPEERVTRGHWRMVLTAGLGFFTDAYDLFIIGTVTTILTPLWHLSTADLMWLNSTSLLAAVVGSVFFGRLADRLGRRAMALAESLILAAAALASALSTSFAVLVALRAVMGVAIGGDYSTSSIIASEFSTTRSRGRLIATVFAMQGVGLVLGPLYAALLLVLGVPLDTAWRLMLGFGVVPALVVAYLRYTMPETPRFLAGVRGDAEAARQSLSAVAGPDTLAAPPARPVRARLSARPFLTRLVGTAGAWFLMDIAFYGNGVSSSLILKALEPHATLLHTILTSALIFLLAALPGYGVAALAIDHMGRKRIQVMGFVIMALAYASIWLVPAVLAHTVIFLVIYAVSYFFIEFGPNTTTFVYPAEVFPVNVRATGNGISAATGKFGAFVGAFLFPLVLTRLHISGLMGLLALVAVGGAILTLVCLPEPKGLALEVASGEHLLDESGHVVAG